MHLILQGGFRVMHIPFGIIVKIQSFAQRKKERKKEREIEREKDFAIHHTLIICFNGLERNEKKREKRKKEKIDREKMEAIDSFLDRLR